MGEYNGAAVSVSTPAFQTHTHVHGTIPPPPSLYPNKISHAPFPLFSPAPELILQHSHFLVVSESNQRNTQKKEKKQRRRVQHVSVQH